MRTEDSAMTATVTTVAPHQAPGSVERTGTAVAGRPAGGSANERLFFFDSLRFFAIALVVVLHASITYMSSGPAWWYVADPDQSQGVFFLAVVLLVDVPIMPILFFAAGYFALPSLRRRGVDGFLREKALRIGAPWLLGVVLLAPLETYMYDVSRHTGVDYLTFLTREFIGPLYQQSVYWFLGVLFACFVIAAWAWLASPRLRAAERRIELPTPTFFLGFVAATAAGSALFAGRYGPDDWQPSVLVFQPARVAFYIGYFVLGACADRRGWFREDGYTPEIGPWAAGALVASVAYLGYRLNVALDGTATRAAADVLFSVFCLTAVMALLAIFRRRLNTGGPVRRLLGSNSFGVYYLHPLVLYPLAFVFVGVAIAPLAKVAVLVVVTLALSLAGSDLVLRRAPGLRRLFG